MACVDCFSGHVHTATPTGRSETIHGIPTYVAEPDAGSPPKGLVIVISDAFGWSFSNIRVLADEYAKKGGLLVYVPDFMMGIAMPVDSMETMAAITAPAPWTTTLLYKPVWVFRAIMTAVPWWIKTRISVCQPRIFSYLSSIRTSAPPFETAKLKIGVAGFCWGGKHAFLLAADPSGSRVARYTSSSRSGEGQAAIEPLIDCAFTAHPSFIDVPKDCENASVPLSVTVGDVDMMMKREQIVTMKEILEVKKRGDHEVVVIPGATHGFAVRLDPKDEFMVGCADKAETQALAWFEKHLS
ncbi:Alpha/Beta hydrolase protein [Amylocarpus encephaloides]|uniref:Alpha/Beta hydrolase protein n=1 Tax=Amylocarpus encephaloides TaxID=45428 RepID=A0A9P7YD07_9HELO|nr:Alpha/Beta hydrolase protein [Amylocarpus encephaloides]